MLIIYRRGILAIVEVKWSRITLFTVRTSIGALAEAHGVPALILDALDDVVVDVSGASVLPAGEIEQVRLADLERIRSLSSIYCFALDSEDVPLLKSVFWSDATDDHGSLFKGQAWDFADYFLSRRGRVRPTMHVVMNHIVRFDAADPDHATGVVYGVGYQFAHARPVPRTRAVLGRYEDVYRRRAQEWKIQDRRFVYVGAMTEQTEQVES